MSPEKKQALLDQVTQTESKFSKSTSTNEQDLIKGIDKALSEHIGQRAKKSELFKDSLNLVGSATGLYALRAAGVGATMLYERHKKLKEAKAESDEKVSFFKDTIAQGIIDNTKEMAGQGKLKKLSYKDWGKYVGMLGAATKPLLAGGLGLMAVAGYSEVSEKGIGAFTKIGEQLQDRADEINQAIKNLSSAEGLDRITKLKDVVLKTLNLQQTFDRTTLNAFESKDSGAEVAAAGVAANPEAAKMSAETMAALKTLTTETIEADTTSVAPSQPVEMDATPMSAEAKQAADQAAREPFDDGKSSVALDESKFDLQKEPIKGGVGMDEKQFDLREEPTMASTEPDVGTMALDTKDIGTDPEKIIDNMIKIEADKAATSLETSGKPAEEIAAVQEELMKTMAQGDIEKLEQIITEQNLSEQSAAGLLEATEAKRLATTEIIPITPEEFANMKTNLGAALHASEADKAEAIINENIITPEQSEDIKAQVKIEQSLGINTYDGSITEEELDKLGQALKSDNNVEARVLVSALDDRGVLTPEQSFALNHNALDHTGFTAEPTATEVAPQPSVEQKVNISIELGQEGGPQHLEQAFQRLAADNANLGGSVDNVSAARILNVSANMSALAEGGIIIGIDGPTEFSQYVTIDGDNITITDYKGFKDNILDKLQAHSERIITPDNVANSGAVAFIDNIKNETWADMIQPDAAPEEIVNFDADMIDQAESDLFYDHLSESGTGEMATDINVINEDTGSFELAGETVQVTDGHIVSVGGNELSTPVSLGAPEARDTLLSEAMYAHSQRLLSEMNPELQHVDLTQPGLPEPTMPEHQVETHVKHTLYKLDLTEGQGARDWEFLKNKPLDDLLNKDIEGHAGPAYDALEGRHRSELREFVQKAINNGDIKPPHAGGPQTIEVAIHDIAAAKSEAQLNHDLKLAEKVVQNKEAVIAAAEPVPEPEIVEKTEKPLAEPEPDVMPVEKTTMDAEKVTAGAETEPIPSLEELEEDFQQTLAAEAHYQGLTSLEITDDKIAALNQKQLQELDASIKEQVKALTSVREVANQIGQEKIDLVVGGYQEKMHLIQEKVGELENISTATATPEDISLAEEMLAKGFGSEQAVSVENIKQLDDISALTKLRDAAKATLEAIKNNTSADIEQSVINSSIRGHQHILEVINSRLEEIQLAQAA